MTHFKTAGAKIYARRFFCGKYLENRLTNTPRSVKISLVFAL